MWMRDRDGRDSAKCLYSFHCCSVQETVTVPEHVAVRGEDEKRALSDGKARHGADARQVGSDLFDAIFISLILQFRNRRPALTVVSDVLPFILANGTMFGRRVRLRVLDSAGGANIVCHDSLLFLVDRGLVIPRA